MEFYFILSMGTLILSNQFCSGEVFDGLVGVKISMLGCCDQ